jgi:hypothetical protein
VDGYLAIEVPRPQSGAEGLIEVVRIGLVGDTLWQRELAYDPVPYSDTDLDSIAAHCVTYGARTFSEAHMVQNITPFDPFQAAQGDNRAYGRRTGIFAAGLRDRVALDDACGRSIHRIYGPCHLSA